MKKYFIAGVVLIAGATGIYVGIEDPSPPAEQGDNKTVLYIAATGGKTNLTLGEAIRVESDLTKSFSAIEKGDETPVSSNVRFTVRTFTVTEAQANSVNANCKCLKVNDNDEPTSLITF